MFKVGQLVMRLMTLPSGRREATLERVDSVAANGNTVSLEGYNLLFWSEDGQQVAQLSDPLGTTEIIPLGCDESYLAERLLQDRPLNLPLAAIKMREALKLIAEWDPAAAPGEPNGMSIMDAVDMAQTVLGMPVTTRTRPC